MTALFVLPGLLIGVLVGWYAHERTSASKPLSPQQQLDCVRELDQCISAAMSSLQAYKTRLLVGKRLSENGSASTKPASPSADQSRDRSRQVDPLPLREPLDGKTLLDVKREVDGHIRECACALTRSTAVLEEETIQRAQELMDALVATRKTLEAEETENGAAPDAVQSHVAQLHRSRTRFLNTVRSRLGLSALSTETEERLKNLNEQAFSSDQCPRPFMETGIRLPQERF